MVRHVDFGTPTLRLRLMALASANSLASWQSMKIALPLDRVLSTQKLSCDKWDITSHHDWHVEKNVKNEYNNKHWYNLYTYFIHTLILYIYNLYRTSLKCSNKAQPTGLISTTALHILGARQIHQHQTTSFGGLTNHGFVWLSYEKSWCKHPVWYKTWKGAPNHSIQWFNNFSCCLDDVSHHKEKHYASATSPQSVGLQSLSSRMILH